MTLQDIAQTRLISQQIENPGFDSVKKVVQWMGAIQAQDFNMAKWAIGVRLPGSTEKSIEDAFNKGAIIRTHVLRPTWHIVPSEDIRWMLELTAPRIKASAKSRQKELGLTPEIFKKTNSILKYLLKGNNHLTREEILPEFKKAGIDTGANRSSHLLMMAELEALICSGRLKNGKPTYALCKEWLPAGKRYSGEKALARLADNYFRSHGPATINDFKWWSGLTAGESKQALEMAKSGLISEKIGEKYYWMGKQADHHQQTGPSVFLLPAFDEFIVSYTDRSASLLSDVSRKTVTTNGLFRPTIVIDGVVTGIWKRVIKNDHVAFEFEFFKKTGKTVKGLIRKSAVKFGNFIQKKTNIILKT